MGAVHGVYLKYVGLSALSYAGYALLMGGAAAAASSSTDDVSTRGLAATSAIALPLWRYHTCHNVWLFLNCQWCHCCHV